MIVLILLGMDTKFHKLILIRAHVFAHMPTFLPTNIHKFCLGFV